MIQEAILIKDEGFRERPYLDSKGYWTFGIGFKLSGVLGLSSDVFKGISVDILSAGALLRHVLDKKRENMANYENIKLAMAKCNKVRLATLECIAYQLGSKGLAMFVNALGAMAKEDWPEAARQFINSKWHADTPERCKRMAYQIESGELHPYYK